MPYSFLAFLAVTIFAFVHIIAEKTRKLNKETHGKFLSAGGGVAIAYVFVDLLPKLCKNDRIVRQALSGVFPYFERHVFIMALLGFLLFFAVDRMHTFFPKNGSFWLTFLSYALFNFLVGYAVSDQNNPEVRPLALFTFALGLHYFRVDYSLNQEHGKWILITCLFLGWLIGNWFVLSKPMVAIVSAFIGGGVVMNVTAHELPKENPQSLGSFLFGAALYTAILLMVGS